MPPGGLYPIPRNHLYGGGHWSLPRPKYNTIDYQDNTSTPAKTPTKGLAQHVDGAAHGDMKSAEKTSAKKKKKEHAVDSQDTTASEAPTAKARSDVSNSKRKNKTKDSKGEDNARDKDKSAKKRKRESTGMIETPTTSKNGISNNDLVLGLGPGFIEGVKSYIGDLGASFTSSAQKAKPAQATPKLNKKQKTEKVKPATETAPPESAQKPATAQKDAPASHRKTKEKKTKDKETKTKDKETKTKDSEKKAKYKERKEKKHQLRMQRKLEEEAINGTQTKLNVAAASASPYATTPRKTPVPLPPPFAFRQFGVIDKLNGKHSTPDNDGSHSNLVNDGHQVTPTHQGGNGKQGSLKASRHSQSTPVAKRPNTPVSSISASSRESTPSPSSSGSSNVLSLSAEKIKASSAAAAAHRSFVQALGSDSSDSSESSSEEESAGDKHLHQHKKTKDKEQIKTATEPKAKATPIPTPGTPNDQAKKNKNKGKGKYQGISTSLLEPGPSTPKRTPKHPSISTSTKHTPTATASKHSTSTAAAAAAATTQAINYTTEAAHLTAYLTFRDALAAASPPPCLHRATGCTTKQHSRLAQQLLQNPVTHEPGNLDGNTDSTGHEAGDAAPTPLQLATQSVTTAETLLQLAVRAHMCVPLTDVAGTYALFCPGYSAAHRDTWEMGMRTLVITVESTSSPYGFAQHISGSARAYGHSSEKKVYKAHLSLPPRSLPFTTSPFPNPTHASFAPITLHTQEEGYDIDIVFLGSGYVVLRMDLGLLLCGRRADGVVGVKGGRGVMEFVGVREGAVVWGGGGGGRE
ncbi:hypothetical protein IQ07DRAFT_654874 [Pyrenochaeta sp. DS3sAY3a]|nr:hypothetical protein IQ07DRAFT_654874 [Pyrenochaeta sp. DS3sAY3a]